MVEIDWKHRRGVLYAFLTGMVLLPLLLFCSAGWTWSAAVSLSVASGLALLQHKWPTMWQALGADPDPRRVERETSAHAAAGTGVRGW